MVYDEGENYECPECGGVITVMQRGKGKLVCCGEEMNSE